MHRSWLKMSVSLTFLDMSLTCDSKSLSLVLTSSSCLGRCTCIDWVSLSLLVSANIICLPWYALSINVDKNVRIDARLLGVGSVSLCFLLVRLCQPFVKVGWALCCVCWLFLDLLLYLLTFQIEGLFDGGLLVAVLGCLLPLLFAFLHWVPAKVVDFIMLLFYLIKAIRYFWLVN